MSRGIKICGAEVDAYFTPAIECEKAEEQEIRSGQAHAVAGEKKSEIGE